MNKTNSFSNKVVIVTGGANGIGYALCKALAAMQAIIIVADINLKKAEEVVKELQAQGIKAWPCYVNVAEQESVKALFDFTLAQTKTLDYIFNNAGVASGGEFIDIPLADYKKVIDINLMGVIYGSYFAYEIFSKQGYGHIVNISSASAFQPAPLLASYSISKVAVLRLSDQIRIETMGSQIDISVICPGFIDTGIESGTVAGTKNGKSFDWYAKQLYASIFYTKMDVDKCAEQILAAVIKKQYLVIFPFVYKFIYWLNRFFPSFILKSNIAILKKFREIKNKP